MSSRTPAGDKGTADRIEADDGGYWVRLVTKQALRREGVCMDNCLDSQGYGQDAAGDEEMVSDGFWSLRKADGLSYLLVEVVARDAALGVRLTNARGPRNSNPSGWSIRQLSQLVAAFRAAGAVLLVPEHIALTGEDGRTWRPDKAPAKLRRAHEASQPQPSEVIAPWVGTTGAVSVVESFRRMRRKALRRQVQVSLQHRSSDLAAIQEGITRGLVTYCQVEEIGDGSSVEHLTVTLPSVDGEPARREEVLTPNDDGSFRFRQFGPEVERILPSVRLAGTESRLKIGFGDSMKHELVLKLQVYSWLGPTPFAQAVMPSAAEWAEREFTLTPDPLRTRRYGSIGPQVGRSELFNHVLGVPWEGPAQPEQGSEA